MQQNEVRVEIIEHHSIEECIICGCQECTKCKSELKNDKIKNTVFISVSGVTMTVLSLATTLTSTAFIGIGLSLGSLVSLLFYQ